MGSGCAYVGVYAGLQQEHMGVNGSERTSGWRGHRVERVHEQVGKDVGGRDPARHGSGMIRWAQTGCEKVVGAVNSSNG